MIFGNPKRYQGLKKYKLFSSNFLDSIAFNLTGFKSVTKEDLLVSVLTTSSGITLTSDLRGGDFELVPSEGTFWFLMFFGVLLLDPESDRLGESSLG